jgi:hypothetical protein
LFFFDVRTLRAKRYSRWQAKPTSGLAGARHGANGGAISKTGRIRREMPARVEARQVPLLRATAANGSLTLPDVGSGDTEKPVAKMALASKKSVLPATEERRRFQRVRVHLLGRYMLPDRREFPCQIINMSPGGLALLAPGIGNVGDRVIAYLDHIGRVEGKITRIIDNGFAMSVSATARKRDKLAAQLTWLANRDILNLPEDRRHDRIIPRNPIALLTLEDGTKMTCRIIDLSLSGAAIAAENRPPLRSLVMLGKVQSRVVRNLEEGFALEFVHEQLIDTLEESVTAR